MLNIAICDDDEQFVNSLEDLLYDYLKNNNYKADIQIFTDPDDFIKYLNDESVDLLFLDIEFEKITGVDIGNNLRKNLHNDLIQIVFVSATESYAMQLFNIRPFDFLVKPVDYKKVNYLMEEYNRIYRVQQNFFEYHMGKQVYKIDEQAVLYFQSEGRKIKMVTSIGDKQFYGKLSEVAEKLKANSFFQVHKSYIINSRYVLEYGKEHVVMTNKERIPVSRPMREKLNKLIIEEKWGV